MANTYSKSANDFIDANAKTKTSKSLAEFAVNMAVKDFISIVEEILTNNCPHIDVCNKRCENCHHYLHRYINQIKQHKLSNFKK